MPKQMSWVLLVRSGKNASALSKVLPLDHAAYQVETTVNAQEAWERVRQAPDFYDVIVLDATPRAMAEAPPSLLEIDFIHHLRGHCPNTTVIVCLDSPRTQAWKAIQAGAFRYLSKPVSVDELAVVIEHVIEYRRWQGTAEPHQPPDSCRQPRAYVGVGKASGLCKHAQGPYAA